MYGLVDIQRSLDSSHEQGMAKNAELEKSRNIANQQLDAQKKQGQMQAAGMGAGIGAYAAAGSIGGPAGAAIGAGIGFLTYSLL